MNGQTHNPEEVGDFSKFAFPLIRKLYPRLTNNYGHSHIPPDQGIFEESINYMLNGLDCIDKWRFNGSVIITGKNGSFTEIVVDNDGIYKSRDKIFYAADPNFIDDIRKFIINRCIGKQLDDDPLVEVQPMSQPSSLIFFLDFKWSKNAI